MKKGFLLLVAAATTTILVSCGGGEEAEAANEFCDCYKEVIEADKAAGEASTSDELFSAGASIEQQSEAIECVLKWKTKWDGKVDGDKVMEEIKENHSDVHKYFEDKGIKL